MTRNSKRSSLPRLTSLLSQLAIAKESAKFNQVAISGEDNSRLKSSYKKSKGDAAKRTG